MASLKLRFHQEADSAWCNNKQTWLHIISLMKNFDFIRMSPWVFLADLCLDVRISWLHLCLETHSGSFLHARMSQERAACKSVWFICESMIAIPQLCRLCPPEATFWVHFTATTKAKPAKITFYKISHCVFVRGPCLPDQSKVGDPPVHIFNLLNLNHAASPILAMSLKLLRYPALDFGLFKQKFNVSHCIPVQTGHWGGSCLSIWAAEDQVCIVIKGAHVCVFLRKGYRSFPTVDFFFPQTVSVLQQNSPFRLLWAYELL